MICEKNFLPTQNAIFRVTIFSVQKFFARGFWLTKIPLDSCFTRFFKSLASLWFFLHIFFLQKKQINSLFEIEVESLRGLKLTDFRFWQVAPEAHTGDLLKDSHSVFCLITMFYWEMAVSPLKGENSTYLALYLVITDRTDFFHFISLTFDRKEGRTFFYFKYFQALCISLVASLWNSFFQRLVQIGNKIFLVFKTNRETNESVRNPKNLTLVLYRSKCCRNLKCK